MSPFEVLAALAIVFALMLVELLVSRYNERRLRAAGALEPRGDVYGWLRVVYPACFLAMGLEGLLVQVWPASAGFYAASAGLRAALAGLFIFVASKALKTWAMLSLGPNWSFRVLVRPGTPLVKSGPYRYLRHPNYVAIFGELIGVALLVDGLLTGLLSLFAIALLLRRRIAVEEFALGLRA